MPLKSTLTFNTLRCVTPTDPSGEDEPYLWTFFINIGSPDVRQNSQNQFRLSANVSLAAGPGRPGNLGTESVASGAEVHIPPQVGQFETSLQPIVIRIREDGVENRIFIPGSIIAFCSVIDEEAVPRECMEQAFNDLKILVQNRINDFLNNLDLEPIWNSARPNDPPHLSFLNAIAGLLPPFINQLIPQAIASAIQSAQICVLSSGIFNRIPAGLDPEEPVGNIIINLNEVNIINSNMETGIERNIRQPSTGLGGAWYQVFGFLTARLSLSPALIVSRSSVISSVPLETSRSEIRENILCMPDRGTVIEWQRLGHSERYEVFVEYPFVKYRYSIAGQLLEELNGEVTLTTEVGFPEFDGTSHTFVKYRKETRSVKIRFFHSVNNEDAQIQRLVLINNPADGNYSVTVDIEAELPGGKTIPVGSEVISFDGQTIEVPDWVKERVDQCLDQFGIKWAIPKRVNLMDLWGPHQRNKKYEEVIKKFDRVADVLGYDSTLVKQYKDSMAARFKIMQKERGYD